MDYITGIVISANKLGYRLVILFLLSVPISMLSFTLPIAYSQPIPAPSECRIGLVIDDSGSMIDQPGNDRNQLRYAGSRMFVDLLPNNDTLFALHFGTTTQEIFAARRIVTQNDRRDLKGKLANGSNLTSTQMGKAIKQARESYLQNAPESCKSLIVLSDGEPDQNDMATVRSEAQEFSKLNIPIYFILLGNKVSDEYPKELTTLTEGELFRIKNANQILEKFGKIFERIHPEYYLNTLTLNVGQDAASGIFSMSPEQEITELTAIVSTEAATDLPIIKNLTLDQINYLPSAGEFAPISGVQSTLENDRDVNALYQVVRIRGNRLKGQAEIEAKLNSNPNVLLIAKSRLQVRAVLPETSRENETRFWANKGLNPIGFEVRRDGQVVNDVNVFSFVNNQMASLSKRGLSQKGNLYWANVPAGSDLPVTVRLANDNSSAVQLSRTYNYTLANFAHPLDIKVKSPVATNVILTSDSRVEFELDASSDTRAGVGGIQPEVFITSPDASNDEAVQSFKLGYNAQTKSFKGLSQQFTKTGTYRYYIRYRTKDDNNQPVEQVLDDELRIDPSLQLNVTHPDFGPLTQIGQTLEFEVQLSTGLLDKRPEPPEPVLILRDANNKEVTPNVQFLGFLSVADEPPNGKNIKYKLKLKTPAGLASGKYQVQIRISSGNFKPVPDNFTISFEVTPPQLRMSSVPTSSFGVINNQQVISATFSFDPFLLDPTPDVALPEITAFDNKNQPLKVSSISGPEQNLVYSWTDVTSQNPNEAKRRTYKLLLSLNSNIQPGNYQMIVNFGAVNAYGLKPEPDRVSFSFEKKPATLELRPAAQDRTEFYFGTVWKAGLPGLWQFLPGGFDYKQITTDPAIINYQYASNPPELTYALQKISKEGNPQETKKIASQLTIRRASQANVGSDNQTLSTLELDPSEQLESGDYTAELVVMDKSGTTSAGVPVRFTVLPSWGEFFNRNWGRSVFYLILLALGLWLLLIMFRRLFRGDVLQGILLIDLGRATLDNYKKGYLVRTENGDNVRFVSDEKKVNESEKIATVKPLGKSWVLSVYPDSSNAYFTELDKPDAHLNSVTFFADATKEVKLHSDLTIILARKEGLATDEISQPEIEAENDPPTPPDSRRNRRTEPENVEPVSDSGFEEDDDLPRRRRRRSPGDEEDKPFQERPQQRRVEVEEEADVPRRRRHEEINAETSGLSLNNQANDDEEDTPRTRRRSNI